MIHTYIYIIYRISWHHFHRYLFVDVFSWDDPGIVKPEGQAIASSNVLGGVVWFII